MKAGQKLVLTFGLALLILNFVFPYCSYATKEWLEDDKFRSTVRWTFVPIWQALAEHEQAALKGNPFDDTIIQWWAVLGFAVAIIGVCACACYHLGGADQAPSQESSKDAGP